MTEMLGKASALRIEMPEEAAPVWRPRTFSKNSPKARTPMATPAHLAAVGQDAAPELVKKALASLEAGCAPVLEGTGTGGAYRISTAFGSPIAILKPREEEAFASHNPRGLRTKEDMPDLGFRSGAVVPGTGADREAAAYLLDHGHFANVPETILVDVQHDGLACKTRQQASLQEFISHRGPASDFASGLFSASSVQRIALLDLRLVNLDRNDANLLVTGRAEHGLELTPIDHGLCLPDQVAMTTDGVAWMSFPAVKQPWHPEVRAYIEQLDAEADAALLAKTFQGRISEQARLLAWACTRFLQLAAKQAEWTPYELGAAVYRPDFDTPSALEQCLLVAHHMVGISLPDVHNVEATPPARFMMHTGSATLRATRSCAGAGDRGVPDLFLDETDADDSDTCSNSPSGSTAERPVLRPLDLSRASSATPPSSPTVDHFRTLLTPEDCAADISTPRLANTHDRLKAHIENTLVQLVAAGPASVGRGLYLV